MLVCFPDWKLDSRAADGTAHHGTVPQHLTHTHNPHGNYSSQLQTHTNTLRWDSQYSRKFHAGSAAGLHFTVQTNTHTEQQCVNRICFFPKPSAWIYVNIKWPLVKHQQQFSNVVIEIKNRNTHKHAHAPFPTELVNKMAVLINN